MVTLERRSRKSPVLTPSSLPCLRGLATINLTEGCAHGCTYCYTQGYTNYPGPGRVVLFDNTAELVREELARKRRRPARVYFSPSSDPFQPLPQVQEVTFQTMNILLKAGIEISFLTKGSVEERFLSLFAAAPALVFAQVGITTLNAELGRAFEPRAAAPAQRLEAIENLLRIGVSTSARLDPLIPNLTDTEENFAPLLAELKRRNVRTVAASYLFLRPAFARGLIEQMRRLGSPSAFSLDWTWRTFADGEGGGRMLAVEERRRRFSLLKALAAKHGIEIHICTCKNPDLGGSGCRIAGPNLQPSLGKEASLFG